MLKEAFDGISSKMRIDFTMAGNINHNGEKGNAREDTFTKYLRAYIPERYSISKGVIIDADDTQSKQVDVIIHDKLNSPIVFETDSTSMIPIETVYCVVEIKSTLTKTELSKSLINIESVRKLKKNPLEPVIFPTAGLVFSYTSDISLDAIYRNMIEFNKHIDIENQVSCICVLDKGLVVPINKKGMNQLSLIPSKSTTFAQIENAQDSLLLFYLILIQLLNQIHVSHPNMIYYAQKSGMMPTQFIVPMEFTPDDAVINFMNNSIKVKDINSLSQLSKKYFNGLVDKNEYLGVLFDLIVPIIKINFNNLDNTLSEQTLNYFGKNISLKYLCEMNELYERSLVGTLTEDEKLILNEFKKMVWEPYEKELIRKKN